MFSVCWVVGIHIFSQYHPVVAVWYMVTGRALWVERGISCRLQTTPIFCYLLKPVVRGLNPGYTPWPKPLMKGADSHPQGSTWLEWIVPLKVPASGSFDVWVTWLPELILVAAHTPAVPPRDRLATPGHPQATPGYPRARFIASFSPPRPLLTNAPVFVSWITPPAGRVQFDPCGGWSRPEPDLVLCVYSTLWVLRADLRIF